MLTYKPFFREFSTRLKIWGTFTKFRGINIFFAKKGDEITRFDGTFFTSVISFMINTYCVI
jgi:hypothetical protein